MRASRPRPTARGATGLVAIAVALGVLAGPAVPAFAHNSVIGESPKKGTTVTSQPDTVWLETSDALLDVDGATVMDVLGPDGLHYATACPAVEGAVASVPAELGPEGEYTVAWRVVSADGHPITGEFAFTWTPAEGEPLAEGTEDAACSSGGGESVGPGDAVGEPDGGEADAAASGGLGDLLWVAGAGLAVVLAGLAAFLLARRRAVTPEGDVGAAPDQPNGTPPGPGDPAVGDEHGSHPERPSDR